MIVKNLLVVLGFISVSWFGVVSGAPSPSYSKVYVRQNAETTPVEYVNYGYEAPALPLSAPLTSASVVPCVSPCVVPGQSVAAVAPLNAKLVYNSPISNVPVILPPNNDDKLSYEYSYVVYDDNSGDHKQQRELSDGSVVHGQYSLIQPDGYVREVKYTADDIKGFNAVVRNFLPNYSGEKKEESQEKSNEITPCSEVKNEALTQKLESNESSESSEKEHTEKESHEKEAHEKPSHENESHEKESLEKAPHAKGSHEKDSHEKGSYEKGSHEKGSHEKASHEKKDHGEQKSHEEKSEKSIEKSHEKEHKGHEKHGEHSESKSNEKEATKHEKSSSSESGNARSEEDSSSSSEEGECKENKSKGTHEYVIEHHSKEHKAELKSSQSSEKKSSASGEESSEEKEKSEEARSAELISHVQHQPEHEEHHVTHETSAPPYSDFIRCIQSYMEKTKGAGYALGSHSPLAYVLLPSGPC